MVAGRLRLRESEDAADESSLSECHGEGGPPGHAAHFATDMLAATPTLERRDESNWGTTQMGTNEPAGIDRRTFVKGAAWSVPVIAATTAVPLAAASNAAEITAWFVTTCGGRDRLTLFITNHTSEPLQVFADVDLDGDGEFEAGDGPVVDANSTQSFGYGLYSNSTPTYRVSTAREVYLLERVVVDCPPIGFTSQTALGIVGETSSPVTLTLRNETASSMQVYVDLDFNNDGITDSTDLPLLAPFEERSIVYNVTETHIGLDVRNDIGYSETTRISWAN